MIKKIKTWLIRLLGGFTESEMKNVLNALDKIILEKAKIMRADSSVKFKTADVVCLNCAVEVKPTLITPWYKREGALEMLEHEFKESLLDELWKHTCKAFEFSGEEQMIRARAKIYVLDFYRSTGGATADECIERT